MKYLVIGAGGTGGCIGAYLARAGQEVTLIARGAHGDAIRSHGLTLREAQGSFTVRPAGVETMETYADTPDVIFVCVKGTGLPDVAPFLRRAAGKDTVVIPILNIFGTGGMLQQEAPDCLALDGTIYTYSMIAEPGVIARPSGFIRLLFGYRRGQEHRLADKVKQIETDLCEAGIEGILTDRIEQEALRKFSYTSPIGAAGLYYHAVAADFQREGAEQDAFRALIREVAALGQAMDAPLPDDIEEINMAILRGLTPEANTSMQRDVAAGRPSEIDGLVHRVVRLGREYGVSLPWYEKISAWADGQGIV